MKKLLMLAVVIVITLLLLPIMCTNNTQIDKLSGLKADNTFGPPGHAIDATLTVDRYTLLNTAIPPGHAEEEETVLMAMGKTHDALVQNFWLMINSPGTAVVSNNFRYFQNADRNSLSGRPADDTDNYVGDHPNKQSLYHLRC